MSLLTASNLSKSFGPNDLFGGVSFSIPQRARIALVGPNGVGKTTLLRILLGEEEPSAGEVQTARGVRLGFLPQEAQFFAEGALWDECLTAFSGLLEMQRELTRLEHDMADPEQAESALEAYAKLQPEFERQGGYTFETRVRQTLTGLGFAPGDFHRPLGQLSGGQRTRALLARLLLSEPDLLLLDEPTNHLDIAAVEWLEDYLKEWSGAVLIVSHDRYFMDQVAQTIWEMTPAAFEIYHGNYSAFLAQREERYTRRIEEYEAQREFIEKEEEYIRRNIAGQNTRQAQGRRKRLERMLEEARLTPPTQKRRLRIQLGAAQRSGDLVIRTTALEVGYEDEGRPLFAVPDLVLRRGECAALIGPNGAGKTTFLKTLLGQTPPYSGEAELGASLQVGYFAQAHEGLTPTNTLTEEIFTVAPNMRPGEARDYLAKFLFTGDDVFKPVSVLSGGERGRLALAKLSLSGANLLLLDEPTNHLDLPAQEVLQSILGDFAGTILLVSHDRYLIDALATQIWDVEPSRARLRQFAGSYSEYRQVLLVEREREKAAQEATRRETEQKTARAAGPSGRSNSEERKRKARIQAVEDQVVALEAELAAVTRRLENPPNDPGQVQRLGADYVRVQGELEALLAEWEALHEG